MRAAYRSSRSEVDFGEGFKKGAGKPFRYVVLQDKNRYLTRAATRTQTLEVIEAFMDKPLPTDG